MVKSIFPKTSQHGQEFTVLSTDGDARLGGSDIDAQLVEFLANEFTKVHQVNLRDTPHTHQDLWDKAEICKKDLSVRNSTLLTLSLGEKTARVNLDRDDFNDLIELLLQKTEECLDRVVEDAKIDWSDIDRVLLVGGSSKIPAVKELVEKVTGKEPARDTNPDECVALGAAIQAAITTVDEANITPSESQDSSHPTTQDKAENIDIKVIDVASHSLGVRAFSSEKNKYVNSTIIPRLTKIPCEMTKTFATSEDNQSRIEFEVLQGEDEDPHSPNVDRIGKAGLKNLPPHTAGELLIDITLKYTNDGIIEVIAKEQKSGQIAREVVMQKSGTLPDEVIEEKRKQLETMNL